VRLDGYANIQDTTVELLECLHEGFLALQEISLDFDSRLTAIETDLWHLKDSLRQNEDRIRSLQRLQAQQRDSSVDPFRPLG